MINLKTLLGLPSFLHTTDRLLGLDLYLAVDNREVDVDGIFVAIVGERYNPLKHLDKIFDSGCRFVVYEMNPENDNLIADWKKKLVFIAVSDILQFVQEAGFAVANTFKSKGGKIVGISGSNGKTTTKEMLTHILQSATDDQSVIATQKNNNNHLGVPFTLFQIRKTTSVAIVELGSNHPGEIEHLCKMIRPQYGVTTNIGDTHLEFFGTRDNVFKEEATLYHYVSEKFFINNDDELLNSLNDSENTARYGKSGDFVFNLDSKKINEHLIKNKNILGDHNFTNLMLASAIASNVLSTSVDKVLKYAESFKPTANRSQWIERDGQHIFLDAYNANPSSMKIALAEFLKYTGSIGAKPEEIALILGDMNELGSNEQQFHQDFGASMDSKHAKGVMFVGRFSGAYSQGYQGEAESVNSVAEHREKIKKFLENFKYVFIKGSRSLQLETILDIR